MLCQREPRDITQVLDFDEIVRRDDGELARQLQRERELVIPHERLYGD